MNDSPSDRPGVRWLFDTAWSTPFYCAGALFRFGLGPLLIAMILWPPSYNLRINDHAMSLTDGVFSIRDVIGFLASMPFAAAFAAGWSRLIVEDNEGAMGSVLKSLDRRTWRVILAFVKLLLLLCGYLLMVAVVWWLFYGSYQDGRVSIRLQAQGADAIPMLLLMLCLLLTGAWFLLRFALVIPAAAVGDASLGLGESWRLTGRVQFRATITAFLLLLAYAILAMITVFVLSFAAGILGVEIAFYAGLPVLFAIFAFAHALWIGLVSGLYARLAPRRPEPDEARIFD